MGGRRAGLARAREGCVRFLCAGALECLLILGLACQLNLLKRLLSLTGPKFSSSSSARSSGERPIMVDREIRFMAMVSLLAVFVDIVP